MLIRLGVWVMLIRLGVGVGDADQIRGRGDVD